MSSQSRTPIGLPNGRSLQRAMVDGRFSSVEATPRQMKRFYFIGVLAVAAVAVVFLFQRCNRSNSAQFQTVTVSRGPITQVVTATGTLNPVVNVQVGSQVSGNIQKLFVDYNSEVKAGQLIAQIDPALFQATVTQAEGDLANAHAGLELARINATRTRALVAKQNSAQSELDAATAALHQAEANVKIKQGALDKAKADLDHCAITSPIDGVVISRSVDVGQTVAASLQAPVIFTIANDLGKMQIDSNVAEADVGAVEVNQMVDFTVDAFPNRTFHGKVVQVRNAPITVQNVVTYDTVIGVSNSDMKLKPGMTANVSIVIANRDDVLKISNAALRFRPAENKATESKATAAPRGPRAGSGSGRAAGEHRVERTVYVLASGDVKPVQIKTGISDGVFLEVLEGLKEGDRVVTASLSATAESTPPATNPFTGGNRRRF
jgi:HlyD family secretion protein